MNLTATRVAILIAELMTFFIVTAFAVQFISYAGALEFAAGDKPPATFPVIVYDGDRARPDPKNYRVMPWSEWEKLADKKAGATLLMPEAAGKLKLGEQGNAEFTAKPEGEARQSVDLRWTGNSAEQQVRYNARERTIEPHYFRNITTITLFIGGALGFAAGMYLGRVLRRRWLGQTGYFVPKA
ncbi:MAG TPA: hypothetical protein VJQ51_02625 [Burkholderiales bacterium]|nr:hypothetical protein [Burkholderiales bacterium]